MWNFIFIVSCFLVSCLESWFLMNKSKKFRDLMIKLTVITFWIILTIINFAFYSLWRFAAMIIIELICFIFAIIEYKQDEQMDDKIEDMAKDEEETIKE